MRERTVWIPYTCHFGEHKGKRIRIGIKPDLNVCVRPEPSR